MNPSGHTSKHQRPKRIGKLAGVAKRKAVAEFELERERADERDRQRRKAQDAMPEKAKRGTVWGRKSAGRKNKP